MAGVELKRGPNRWVVLHSGRDRSSVLERFAELAPAVTGATATPITPPFEGEALATREGLSPVPRTPRNAQPFLLEFQGDGGIIVWPGSREHDPMLALDAVLIPPGRPPGATQPPSAPGPVLTPAAPAEPSEPPAGSGTAAAVQVGAVGLGLGFLWWILSRR